MKTTTLKGEEQVFTYPTFWPKPHDLIQNVLTELTYEVRRVRPNGDVVVYHQSSGMARRVTPDRVCTCFRAVHLIRRSSNGQR